MLKLFSKCFYAIERQNFEKIFKKHKQLDVSQCIDNIFLQYITLTVELFISNTLTIIITNTDLNA